MSKKSFPEAFNDFHKTNGTDTSFRTDGPSLTRQEFKEECDINTLMSKYEGHAIGGPGNLPGQPDPSKMFYGDFTSLPGSLMEYHEFMDRADAAFMSLPAKVRKEFDNDAVMFVEFASDPGNLDQLRTWGLAPPAEPQEPPPMRVEVVNPVVSGEPVKPA